MKEDASLFRYELAIVIIIKDGARYMREWLDYHLLVGVDHFYFYDNDSSDNLKEVLQRYIDAGLVDYKFFPGKSKQWAAYNDAVKHHRFDCRYMAFIDDDEFLRATDHSRSIKDIVREIFEQYPDAGALTLNGFNYGSSGYETADYSIDVIERFTRRATTAGTLGKVIANPRLIAHIENPHYVNLCDGFRSINADGETNSTIDRQSHRLILTAPAVDKIFYNHYGLKSKEEFVKKFSRGDAFFAQAMRDMKQFNDTDAVSNEVVDAGIVEYRRACQVLLSRGGGVAITIEPRESINRRLFNVAARNVMPIAFIDTPDQFFAGKAHTFLACRAISQKLAEDGAIDRETSEMLENLALRGIIRTVSTSGVDLWSCWLLVDELPNLLNLKCSALEEFKDVCRHLFPKAMDYYCVANNWDKYKRLDHALDMINLMDDAPDK